MNTPAGVQVEVVYAESGQQFVCPLHMDSGATVADALKAVAADARFAKITLQEQAVGIFGRLVEPAQVLADGDRVEIYRELTVDAKAARLRRAEVQKRRTQKDPGTKPGAQKGGT